MTISPSSFAPRSCASCGGTPSSCARSGTACCRKPTLSSLTPARRRELYGAVASAFEELHEGSLDDHLERLAHYHAQSGNVAQAIVYLDQAAARADELGAGSRATELRERARELTAAHDSR